MSTDNYRYRHGEPMDHTKAFVLIRDAFADAAVTMHPESVAYALGYAEFILEQHKAHTKERQEEDLQAAARTFRRYEPKSERENWAHGLAWTFCEMVFDKARPACAAVETHPGLGGHALDQVCVEATPENVQAMCDALTGAVAEGTPEPVQALCDALTGAAPQADYATSGVARSTAHQRAYSAPGAGGVAGNKAAAAYEAYRQRPAQASADMRQVAQREAEDRILRGAIGGALEAEARLHTHEIEAREAARQAAAVRAAAEVARTPDPRTEVQYADDLQAADAGAYEEKLRELIRVVRCMPDATSARPTRAALEKTAELIQTLERWGLIATVSPA